MAVGAMGLDELVDRREWPRSIRYATSQPPE
jgi:hypothetical protein